MSARRASGARRNAAGAAKTTRAADAPNNVHDAPNAPEAPAPIDPAEAWYADGLRFTCTQCGNCCTGPPGTVSFTAVEARRLAQRLGVSEKTFYKRYARKVDGRWSLEERPTEHGLDCVFLDRTSVPGKAVCGVYDARPTQCRTWPFWPENLLTRRTWLSVKHATPCPGMETGKLVPLEAIRIQRDAKGGEWVEEEGMRA